MEDFQGFIFGKDIYVENFNVDTILPALSINVELQIGHGWRQEDRIG
jgi:hypothetical protein